MTVSKEEALRPSNAKPQKGRILGLDGLRGILALCVIVVHATAHLTPGVLAVTKVDLLGQAIVVFFVMSGFLIYRPFLTRILDGRGLPHVGDYARNRLLRVLPVYLVIFLVANFALRGVFLTNAMESMEPRSDAGTGVITDPLNLLLQLTLLQNYLPEYLQTGINSSWTLTVELAFYALLPLLAWVAVAVRDRTSLPRYAVAVAPALLLLLVGLASRAVSSALIVAHPEIGILEGEWGSTWQAVFARSLPVWADNFAFGMLAAVLVAGVGAGVVDRILGLTPRLLGVATFLLGLVAAVAALALAPKFIATGVALASFGLLLLIVLPPRGREVARLGVALDWLPLRYVGLISLSTYLWHYPVLLVLERLGLFGPDTLAGALYNFVLLSIVTVAVSSVTYWLVEVPAQRWRPKKKKSSVSGPVGPIM